MKQSRVGLVCAILFFGWFHLPAAEPPADQQAVLEHFQAGRQALQQGKLDRAVGEFKEVLKIAPQLVEARMNLSLAYYLRGDYELVVRNLGKVVGERSDLLPARLFLGLSYLKVGQAAKAVPHLQATLKAQPSNPEARRAMAAAYLALNNFRQAAREYRTLFSQEQDKTEAWFWLGRHYFEMSKGLAGEMVRRHRDSAWTSRLAGDVLGLSEKWEEAAKHYTQALEREPRQAGLHTRLGNAYLHTGKFDEAANQYRAELERDRDDEQALLGMVEVSLARGEIAAGHKFAARLWETFPQLLIRQTDFPSFSLPREQAAVLIAEIERLPSGPPTDFLLASLYHASAQTKRAEQSHAALKEQLDQAVRPAPATNPRQLCQARHYALCAATLESQPKLNLPDYLLLGKARLALGEGAKASDAFAAALSFDSSDNPQSLYWLVRTYQTLSGHCFRKVEEIAPNSWRAHQLRAEAHQLREADKEAVEEYRRAIQLKQDDPELRESLAILYFLDNEYDAAQAELEQALQLDPSRGRTHYLLGRLYVARQEPAKAVPYLERALRRDPSLLDARANLGRAYLRLDRPEEAAAQLEKAVELDYYGDLNYSLFLAYRKLGKRELAMQALARSQQMRKSSFARDQAKLRRWIKNE